MGKRSWASRVRRLNLPLAARVTAAAALLSGPLLAARAEQEVRQIGPIDPTAQRVLEQMVRAYRSLRSLQQETTYSGSAGAGGMFEGARLVVQRPNRLLLELTQRTPTASRPVKRRFLCDGKSLYMYDDLRNEYTQEKAPRGFDGFQRIAVSLEVAALAGLDPFSAFSDKVRTLRLDAPEQLDSVPCDVVFMDIGDETRTGEVRFYIGQEDHLLREFTLDSRALPKPKPDKKDDQALDTPRWADETPPEEAPPAPIHFSYENRVITGQAIPKDTFKWVAPPGALRLNQDPTAYLRQDRGKGSPFSKIATPMDLSHPSGPSDLSHPTKVISAKELIDRATRQKKK